METVNANDDIEEYYGSNQILYNIFYSKGTNGLHYGFWYDGTMKVSDAIYNTNEFIMDILKINKYDKVLDAGCGVGGTSIYIAEKTGSKVTGINISYKQIEHARRLATKSKAHNLLDFYNYDFTKTDFDDESYSKIFGIESICHAFEKIDFLREAYRILKKGGKIVVVDGFLRKENLTSREKEIYSKWLYGWGVPNLETLSTFRNDLKRAGFKNIKYYNKFDEIKKSRNRIFRFGFFGYPFSWILYKLGVINKRMHDNTISCMLQKKVFDNKDNIATYGVFVAEK